MFVYFGQNHNQQNPNKMNTLKVIAVCALMAFSASAMAQEEDEPAAQGYIDGKPSNEQQDADLKALEAEEQENYSPEPDPDPTPTLEPGDVDAGNDAATDPNDNRPGLVD